MLQAVNSLSSNCSQSQNLDGQTTTCGQTLCYYMLLYVVLPWLTSACVVTGVLGLIAPQSWTETATVSNSNEGPRNKNLIHVLYIMFSHLL